MIDDHDLASLLAREAAEMLLGIQTAAIGDGRYGGWVGAEADAAAHDFLIDRLEAERPDDAVLSEEGLDDPIRVSGERTWIIDPLDGSDDFGRGAGDWAVHVALTEGGVATAAAVAVPGLELVASTGRPPPVPPRADRRPVVVTGRTRYWVDGGRVASVLDAEQFACGSAGFKAMLVVHGHADVYVHAAPLYEWDVCAPAAVAARAGLAVVAPDGGELSYNQLRPVVPGLVIARPELVDEVLRALSG